MKKEDNSLKKKIKKLKETSRGKAIWRLIKWGIFFFLLFLLCIIAALMPKNLKQTTKQTVPKDVIEKKEKENLANTSTLKKLEDQFLASSFQYVYEIQINGETIKFNGTKSQDKDTGYKETNNGIIKYFIDSTGIYQETTTDKVLIHNLYENLNETYFHFEVLFPNLGALSFLRVDNCGDDCAIFQADNENISYEIELVNGMDTMDNSIRRITIHEEDIVYQFGFSNVKREA